MLALALLLLTIGIGTLLADARVRGLMANSALLAFGTLLIALPWGGLMAWLLSRTDLPGRRAAWLALASILLMPLYLQAGAWRAAGGLEGWWTIWQGAVLLDGWRAAVWIHAVSALPWIVVMAGLALQSVEPELEAAALLEGSTAQTAYYVTWPRSMGGLGVAALWVIVLTASEMTVTDLFRVRTFAEEVFTQMTIGDPSLAQQRVLPACAVLAALAYVAIRGFMKRLPAPVGQTYGPAWVFRLRGFRWAGTAIVVASLVVVVVVPVGSLMHKAGVLVDLTPAGYVRSWSITKCAWLILTSPGQHISEIINTAILASVTATLATVVAIPLAWRMRRGGHLATGVWLLLATALAIPGPVVGMAIINLLNQPEFPAAVWAYDRTILAPVSATFVKSLPWATLVMWQALRTVSSDSLETAELDGAGSLARVCHIALGQRRAATACSWLLAAVVVSGDVAASVLVVPPGFTTLSIHLFILLHYGVEDQVAAILLAELFLYLALAAIVARLIHRFTQRI